MTKENLTLAAIYGSALIAGVAFGLVEAFAVIGVALTIWLIKNEIENRVNEHYRAKYADEAKPRKQASGL